MDSIKLEEEIKIITDIRDRLHSNNGRNTEEITFTINKKEIDALVGILSAGITYYNFTRALQNDSKTEDQKLSKSQGE